MATANAVDIFRESHPTERPYAFNRGLESASRIDRIYIDRLLAPLVYTTTHKAGVGKDHSHGPVITLHTANRIEKGKETWRMNNSALLNEDLFNKILAQNLNVYNLSRTLHNPDQAWANVKKAAKAVLRVNGRIQAARKKAQKEDIKNRLNTATKYAADHPNN